MKSPFLYLSVVGIVILFGLLLVRGVVQPASFSGSQIDPPVPAADFTLTDQNGEAFRLSDHRGKPALVFFGYTNCPDVCPITLANYKNIRGELGDQVNLIFITVDPERDTQEQIRQHLGKFDTAIIGLTGTRAELEPVWKDYGVFQSSHGGGGVEHYDVDHSSRVYAIDAEGNWRLTFLVETDWQSIVKDLRQVMN